MNKSMFIEAFVNTRSYLEKRAYKLTQNGEDAKDLLQETLLLAYVYRKSFKAGTNFKAWMNVIMKNSFLNDLRKKKLRKNLNCKVDNADLFSLSKENYKYSFEHELYLEDLNLSISKLEKNLRIPFVLRNAGFTYTEIAEKLNLPLGTVKSRLFSARSRLKKLTQQHL